MTFSVDIDAVCSILLLIYTSFLYHAVQLEGKGFTELTLKGIVNKMKKLRQKYKVEKGKTRKSGNGRYKKWKFFDQTDSLLSHRHNITALVVLDTMATECQGNETDHLDQTLSTQNSND